MHSSRQDPWAPHEGAEIRIAAAGDVHFTEANATASPEAFAHDRFRADLILIAGDLTTHGEPEQAALLAQAVRGVETPIYAVLGNHDLHVNRGDELIQAVRRAAINVLDRCAPRARLCGAELGIVGVKGFVGGFAGSHLPDFGEPSLRRVYAETTAEVEALEAGAAGGGAVPLPDRADALRADHRHAGRRAGASGRSWAATASRPDHRALARPRAARARPRGHVRGRPGDVPVYNVSVPVMQRDFWVFEMTGSRRAPSEVH